MKKIINQSISLIERHYVLIVILQILILTFIYIVNCQKNKAAKINKLHNYKTVAEQRTPKSYSN